MSKIKEWCQMLVDSGVITQLPANIDAATYEQYAKYLEDENEELTRNARQLELTLFTVVRNFKVLPVGLKLLKTNKEITDMTLETIEKIKQLINYNAVEELIKESKDD